MDNNLTNRIAHFLSIEHPTDQQVKEGAAMLLQCDPIRSRAIYNTAQRRPQAMLPWIRTDLTKFLGVRQRGLQRSEVPAYNAAVVKKVKESLSVRPENVEPEKKPAVKVEHVRSKRSDHDALPENIKAIWERNAERWKKIRQYHNQLLVMTAKPDYQPCDGNELCHMLLEADSQMRQDYGRYDGYKSEESDALADNVKAAQTARTAISRALNRKQNSKKQLEDLQEQVNILYRLGGSQKDATVKKLKDLGIVIPDA